MLELWPVGWLGSRDRTPNRGVGVGEALGGREEVELSARGKMEEVDLAK